VHTNINIIKGVFTGLHYKLQTHLLIKEGTLHEEENLKFGHGPQRWAQHQDELAISTSNLTQYLGGITGVLCSWGEINTGTCPSRLGESQI
jgi:hypothetical protein